MLVGTDERCARCGTLLRSGRRACPSCGLDQSSLEAHPSQVIVAATPIPDAKPIGMKKSICPACMSSVRDDSMIEYDGNRICPECHDRIKGKLARKS